MANTIKTADLNGSIAAKLFANMNPGRVEHVTMHNGDIHGVLVTDVDPVDLDYPEGWYFAKGSFRNKHNSSTGFYSEVPMLKSDGLPW